MSTLMVQKVAPGITGPDEAGAREIDLQNMPDLTNVQEPVREMFGMFMKTINAQAQALQALEARVAESVAEERMHDVVGESLQAYCTNLDAVNIIHHLNHKADADACTAICNKLEVTSEQVENLSEMVEQQQKTIAEVNEKIEVMYATMNQFKAECLCQCEDFCEKSICSSETRLTALLEAVKAESLKAEQRASTSTEVAVKKLQASMEEGEQTIVKCINDMRSDFDAEFASLAEGKADADAVHDLSMEVAEEGVTRHEVNQTITQQVTPIIIALSSLEKALYHQSTQSTQSTKSKGQKVASIGSTSHAIMQAREDVEGNNVEGHECDINRIRGLVREALSAQQPAVNVDKLPSALHTDTSTYLSSEHVHPKSTRPRGAGDNTPQRRTSSLDESAMTVDTAEAYEAIDSADAAIDGAGGAASSARVERLEMRTQLAIASLRAEVAGMRRQAALGNLAAPSGGMRSGSVVGGGVNSYSDMCAEVRRNRESADKTKAGLRHLIKSLKKSLRQKCDTRFVGELKQAVGVLRDIALKLADAPQTKKHLSALSENCAEQFDLLEALLSPKNDSEVRKKPPGKSLSRAGSCGSTEFNELRDDLESDGDCDAATKSGAKTQLAKPGKLTPSIALNSGEEASELNRSFSQLRYDTDRLAGAFEWLSKRESETGDDIDDMHIKLAKVQSQLSSVTETNRLLQERMTGYDAKLSDYEESFRIVLDGVKGLRDDVAECEEVLRGAEQRGEKHSAIAHTLGNRVDGMHEMIAALADRVEKSGVTLSARTDMAVGQKAGGAEESPTMAARWLWTAGRLTRDHMIPWDMQVLNSHPRVLLWQHNTTSITTNLPGLYRLCVAVFSRVPCVLTVYLRDEPLFTLDCGPAGTSLAGTSLTSLTSLTHAGHTGDTGDTHVDKGGPRGGPSAQRSHRPSFLGQTRAALPRTLRDANVDSAAMDRIKRFSHSCGQVTSHSFSELIALPSVGELQCRLAYPTIGSGTVSAHGSDGNMNANKSIESTEHTNRMTALLQAQQGTQAYLSLEKL